MNFDPKSSIDRLSSEGNIYINSQEEICDLIHFLDPKDVKYFRPIELFTRNGLRGHIRESLGTHSNMKCIFSVFIKHGDTVCLVLYRRVYPVWNS